MQKIGSRQFAGTGTGRGCAGRQTSAPSTQRFDKDLVVFFAVLAVATLRSFAAVTAIWAARFRSLPLSLAWFRFRIAAAFSAAALRSALVRSFIPLPYRLSRLVTPGGPTADTLEQIDRQQNQDHQNDDSYDRHGSLLLIG
jgi:hypothetical protein